MPTSSGSSCKISMFKIIGYSIPYLNLTPCADPWNFLSSVSVINIEGSPFDPGLGESLIAFGFCQ